MLPFLLLFSPYTHYNTFRVIVNLVLGREWGGVGPYHPNGRDKNIFDTDGRAMEIGWFLAVTRVKHQKNEILECS